MQIDITISSIKLLFPNVLADLIISYDPLLFIRKEVINELNYKFWPGGYRRCWLNAEDYLLCSNKSERKFWFQSRLLYSSGSRNLVSTRHKTAFDYTLREK
jgi:hypothetical protein